MAACASGRRLLEARVRPNEPEDRGERREQLQLQPARHAQRDGADVHVGTIIDTSAGS